MGPEIHWMFELPASGEPEDCLERLRAAAIDLGFEGVDARVSWLDGFRRRAHGPGRSVLTRRDFALESEPRCVYYFAVDPGSGCEPALFHLALYPRAPCWKGLGSIATWFAGGRGAAHFVSCHVRLVALLDEARALGLRVSVQDDGLFHETRDVSRLLEALARRDELVSRLGAALDAALDSS